MLKHKVFGLNSSTPYTPELYDPKAQRWKVPPQQEDFFTPLQEFFNLSFLPCPSKRSIKRRNMPSGWIEIFFHCPFLPLGETFNDVGLRVQIAVESR